jgi:dihydroflavonol-4-reductase
MRFFVTGSTGLLGNNLVRTLEAAGHSVVGLVRSEEKGRRLLGDTRATLVKGDMRDGRSKEWEGP